MKENSYETTKSKDYLFYQSKSNVRSLFENLYLEEKCISIANYWWNNFCNFTEL